jgi:hypothetical protein
MNYIWMNDNNTHKRYQKVLLPTVLILCAPLIVEFD